MKNHKNIVVVDDEKDILELLKYNLEKEKFKVSCISSGHSAVELISNLKPDLIILDLMLRGINGLDICEILKKKKNTQNIPVLMLTAKGEESDIIKGLEIGADDYVVKPFSVRVLLARISSLLRRNDKKNTPDSIFFDELSINKNKREVRINNKIVDLTYSEFEILFILASHPNWVYTRNQLIDEIRGGDYPVTDRSIDFQFVGLRKKLGNSSRFIKTVRGVGYRFLVKDE